MEKRGRQTLRVPQNRALQHDRVLSAVSPAAKDRALSGQRLRKFAVGFRPWNTLDPTRLDTTDHSAAVWDRLARRLSAERLDHQALRSVHLLQIR